MKQLNFACGREKIKDFDNCDFQKNKEIIYCDANKFPYPFKANTYDFILINQALNMFNEPDKVLYELRRIAKPNAIIEIKVPYFNNKGAYSDFQVKHFFTETTFTDLVKAPCKLNKKVKFKIENIEFIQTRFGKFFGLWLCKKLSVLMGGFIAEIVVRLVVIKRTKDFEINKCKCAMGR